MTFFRSTKTSGCWTQQWEYKRVIILCSSSYINTKSIVDLFESIIRQILTVSIMSIQLTTVLSNLLYSPRKISTPYYSVLFFCFLCNDTLKGRKLLRSVLTINKKWIIIAILLTLEKVKTTLWFDDVVTCSTFWLLLFFYTFFGESATKWL